MSLTDEQKEAVRCEENIMLTACPGSGKTRVIVSKLQRALDDVRGTPRSVACITYTNTAVYEIEARLKRDIQPGDENLFDICTIHSFCLNHIFRPFCHLIKGYGDGFRVLTPDCDEFQDFVRQVCDEVRMFNPGAREFEEFAQLRRNADGSPAVPTGGRLTPAMANAYWKKLREAGYIDFSCIIFYSFRLLEKRPEILRYVSAKFAWILVDEFQDTTDLQVEILTLIANAGKTKFFLVGDPFQSIFGFAGARPELAEVFADRIDAKREPQLSGNFRSGEHVVDHANRLFPRTPPMSAVGEARHFPHEPVWHQGGNPFEVIVDYYLPALEGIGIPIGEAAILAPTWFSLFPLGRQLRDYGVPIVGPGARPYRRNRVFAPLAEQICGYLLEPRPESIQSIERSLFNTLLDATGRTNYSVFSYEGRCTIFRLLEQAKILYAREEGALKWLEDVASAFSEILVAQEYLSAQEADLFAASVEEMKVDMIRNRVDINNLSIDDLGIYASPDAALKLSTLHFAKGREYEAVALIDLHEGRIPHFSARTAEDIEQGKRLFYVGVTRAKRYLMYITDTSDHRNRPSPFLLTENGVGVC